MPGPADFIQRSVHALEAGGLAVWVRRVLVVVAIVALAVYYMYHFRGLATSQAMDQAQIGRAIVTGQGWRTNLVRPRAAAQLQANGKNVAQAIWADTYHAPLPPLVDAAALWLMKSHLKMNVRDLVYAGDKAIALMSIFLFLCSVAVLFFTARRLFDQRLALLACALVLLCDTFWQYSLSGLPQMLLLLLFNTAIYLLVRAVEAKNNDGPAALWLALVGAGFGLLALTHALTIWMFVPVLIFCVFFFRPRWRTALILLAAFAILYTPWLLRNYMVCGHPGGVAIYSVLDGIGRSEAGWMRQTDLNVAEASLGAFRARIITGLMSQIGQLLEHFGWSVVALMFFVSLLHRLKRPGVNAVRWMILAMWAGAVVGMALYGIRPEQGVGANQFHLLFIPLMTCYGFAFLLVQWNRLEIEFRLARIGFIALLFLLCAAPMLAMFLAPKKVLVRWPPYVPPYIAILNDWMGPDEITASDMPWAIAWYADRPSLWLPDSIKTFNEFNDYKIVGRPVNGLYLTPISGSQNTLSDIVKGEYRDWSGFILRTTMPDKFPLKWNILLGVENECTFYSNRDRRPRPAQ